MPTINGQRGAFLRVIGIGQDQSGQYTRVRAEGTTNEIQQLIPQLRQSFATYEITRSYTGAADVVEARIPVPIISTTQPEIPVDNWEQFAEKIEKDILESDIAGIDDMPDTDKALLRVVLDQGVDSEDAYRIRISDNALAGDLYNLAVYGVRSKRVSVPHLRHTQTVSQLWTVKAALTNVDRIISTSTLITSEGVPDSVLFNLPDQTPNRAPGAKLKYGWYKEYPTVRFAAGQRIQIEQEWEYGLWTTVLYGAVL